MTLQKKYNFSEAEKRWQNYWLKNRIFEFDWLDGSKNIDAVYSIDTPPPTVSGVLHMGHVFGFSQTDMIARFQRMQGKNVFFPVGYDDNGLPSERYVEKSIGKKSKEMERSEFTKICDEEIRKTEKLMKNLFVRASYSFSWDEEYRTISPTSSSVSQMSFMDLYKRGLVYRKKEPVIWDVVDQTALAQSELEDRDLESQMNYLKFATDRGEILEIMTTRPELLPACVALLCHPLDFNKYEGRTAITPLGMEVPLIADDRVDREKGTGLVMCCTFGDQTDVEWWLKYNLQLKIILDESGKIKFDDGIKDSLTPKYQQLEGLKVADARKKIIELLESDGKIAREPQKIVHAVKVGERSKFPIEFLVKEQWFVRILGLKERLHEQTDKINWKPKWMKNRLHDWIDGLSWDWCVSRQRFFGIPVPLWYSKRKGEEGTVILPKLEQLPVDPLRDLPEGYAREEVAAETDVFDTWATSSLTPQMAIHSLNDTYGDDKKRSEILKLPFDVRPQGHEIIRTWAFYTIIKSFYHNNSLPWKNIMINGWCLASDGTKMSKSIGNVIDPIEIFDKFGSDAVRYWTATSTPGMDSSYSEEVVKNGQKLVTKLYNCAKFAEIHFDSLKSPVEAIQIELEKGNIFKAVDLWLLKRLQKVMEDYKNSFYDYEYKNALELLETFFWNDFCDNYLEIVKLRCYGANGTKYQGKELSTEEIENIAKLQESAVRTIYIALNSILKLFAPFMPVICEEVYANIYEEEFRSRKSIHARGNFPNIPADIFSGTNYENLEEMGDILLKIVSDVRKYKSEKNISLREGIGSLIIHSNLAMDLFEEDIRDVCNVSNLKFIGDANYSTEIVAL